MSKRKAAIGDQVMSDRQIAEARSRTYQLLSQLYLHGVTARVLPFVQAIPELSAALPPRVDQNLDEMAADHYDVLGKNVFAYESIFLDTEGLVGGRTTDSVLGFYRQSGFHLEPHNSEAPDHIGLQLLFLNWLTKALTDSPGVKMSRVRSLQQQFLDQHLLRWLLPLVQAIRQQSHPFYTALTDLTRDMLLAHRADLSNALLADRLDFALPPTLPLLDDEKVGLKEIASFLLIPAHNGVYLSREDIERLARRQRLPRGFGSRQQMLTNLLHAAVAYDSLDALLGDLSALLDDWRASYHDYLDAPPPVPAIGAVWIERLSGTQEMLDRLRKDNQ
ncbi:MAG: molecular chaperone TorD family protein [Planctomycetota bacterium]|jgi:TorA maturation chaperone TorD